MLKIRLITSKLGKFNCTIRVTRGNTIGGPIFHWGIGVMGLDCCGRGCVDG
ncbi:MAG: hypothetical protein ACTS4T_00690 [Candidatus Hodgkinia cicadicola]